MIKLNKKAVVILAFLIIILMSSALILSQNFPGSNHPALFSHTKAICNSTNFCQDYEIHCESEKMMKMSPITGAAIQFPQDWRDPRDNLTRNKMC